MLHFRLHFQCKRRLTCSLNIMDSTNQTRLPAVARAHCDVFQAGLPWQGMAKLYKGSICCNHGDTICHPKSGYVTTKLHGTSACGCNNNAMFSAGLFSRFLPPSYAGHVNLAGVKPLLFMLNCKYGSPVEIIVFRVQYFFSA